MDEIEGLHVCIVLHLGRYSDSQWCGRETSRTPAELGQSYGDLEHS